MVCTYASWGLEAGVSIGLETYSCTALQQPCDIIMPCVHILETIE